MLDSQTSVASTVLDHPETAAVFQRRHIDFCCKGELSIAAACSARGLDPAAVLGELEATIAARGREHGVDPRALATPALLDHIVATHHRWLRDALPFVRTLATKVGHVHGAHDPRLRELKVAVDELVEALLPHLDVEGRELFPALRAPTPDAAALGKGLADMHREHLAVGALLERVRGLSGDFALPEWACTSYRTLFSELQQVETDVFRHVHLENHVLMPRFVAA